MSEVEYERRGRETNGAEEETEGEERDCVCV